LDAPGEIVSSWVGSVGVGRSTAVIESSRLQRQPDGSDVIGVWQRILFHEVSGGMLVNRSPWELGLGRWGLVGVH
jgi:hypothetical protein